MDESSSPFDRIDVIVAGMERLSARPIDFTYDKGGNVINATTYEATCPKCGHIVSFTRADLRELNGDKHVGCSTCNTFYVGDDQLQSDEIKVKISGQVVEKKSTESVLVSDCPFIDPVAEGSFCPEL